MKRSKSVSERTTWEWLTKYLQQTWLIFTIVVAISLVFRLVGLNKIGHTWDEYAYVGVGDDYLRLIKNGDFSSSQWYSFPDHPPLSRYLYGLAGQFSIDARATDGAAIFKYDWTAPRVLSALFSSLAVGFVFLIGQRVWNKSVGIASAGILMLLPLSIAYGQLITLESLILLLTTACVYMFILYLEENSKKYLVLTGILLGLALATKYTNVLLGVLLGAVWLAAKIQKAQTTHQSIWKSLSKKDLSILLVPVIALAVFWLIWPALWTHPVETFQNIQNWSRERMAPATEYYFGVLQPVPWHYYLGSFVVSTPVVVLVFMCVGLFYYYKNSAARKYWLLVLWLLIPLLQSFYPLRQNGIRYVIMIYPAVALIVGYALMELTKKLRAIHPELPLYFHSIVYGVLLLSLYLVYPYYLDYYNFMTGGNTTVYERKLFELGSWGQGQREAIMVLSQVAEPGSTVGLAVIPDYVAPSAGNLRIGLYNSKYDFTYVITNSFNEFRSDIKAELKERGYVPIHYVTAGGAPIVTIYSKKLL
jgi:4-amino-4-deoxy-L-arabinose transferase-like glycosyltransferase